jgi:hypothetical protein
MAEFEKRAKRHPTDLTDEEWRFIQPFLPPVSERGHKPKTNLREVLDALRHLARTAAAGGCCRTTFRLGRRSIGGSGGSSAGCCVVDD